MNGKCASGVDKTALFDLRDNVLPLEQAEQLHAHVQSCTECSAYLTEIGRYHLLLRGTLHRAPQIQDRLWRDLRHQIVRKPERSTIMSLSRKAILGGFGAVAAAVAIIALFVQVNHYLENRRANLITAQNPSQVTLDNSGVAKFTVPDVVSAPFYVSPDGGTFMGWFIETSGSQTTEYIDRYTASSGKLETIYSPSSDQSIRGSPATDGHYLAWAQSSQSNSQMLMLMNLQTKRITTVESKIEQGSVSSFDLVPVITNGNIFWQDLTAGAPGSLAKGSIKMRDLATGETKTLTTSLALVPGSNFRGFGEGNNFRVDWPYVAFTAGEALDSLHIEVLDITTGTTISLPSPTPVAHPAPSPSDVIYQLAGTTVIAGWLATDSSLNFAQFDVADQPGVTHSWQWMTTVSTPYTFKQDGNFEVNSRLILFYGQIGKAQVILAWDRTQHLTFTVTSYTDDGSGYPSPYSAYIFGNWLVILTHNDENSSVVCSLIDTMHLQLQMHR